jgi:flagellar biosynthesis/type III secretory pathway chaperone
MQDIQVSPEKVTLQQEMSLYRGLLECLEMEWQALINAQEDAILALAAQKEHILGKIINATASQEFPDFTQQDQKALNRLKHEAAVAQARNHRLITSALETVQDFLAVLQSPPLGIYHLTGKVETSSENSLFHRQA